MTEQQRRFCQALVDNGGKKREAAIKAGYSPRTAQTQASDLLKKPEVKEYYEKLIADLEKEVKRKLIPISDKAVRVLSDMLDDPETSERGKLDICKTVLDLAGMKPSSKHEVTGKNGTPLFSFTWLGDDDG